ncbi:GMP reductase 1 isoform X2 [Pteronotus mesoamericanus]|uniref:GMP reductase 1 isoform X2 n=1 Tax=Pteronotus mesoamericanus TaxID=1884717 RepID=UPI0023EB95F4|nr:GMP reductase 1 isoform X2 [Pteronotus parnellii mesoamericanus]
MVDLERTFTFRNSKQTYSGIPIIVANMDTVGTFEMAVVMSQHSMFTAIHKHYTLDDWKLFATNHPECLQHVAVSSGSGKNDLEKMSSILEAVPQIKFICLDVANGYSEHFVEFVKLVRAKFPEHTIMAGNVVTGEMVEELILSGADIIKVGVGPGSVCTTRTKTGVGYPQLSAVIECADSAHGLKGHIISHVTRPCGGGTSQPTPGAHSLRVPGTQAFSRQDSPLTTIMWDFRAPHKTPSQSQPTHEQDGGCTCPGDVAKAFGAGADFVMLGGMFSGHTECAGEVIERNGQKLKLFYGMSSETAMKKHAGGVAEYRASEGKTVEVPYKGDVENTILDILGGLRSTCTYVGAAKLKELSRRATFIRVTQQHNTVFS